MKAMCSLYDALVAINVPNDKARAVVDAMDEDMVTLLATKSDLASRPTSSCRKSRPRATRRSSSLGQSLQSSMTVRLGSIVVVSLSLLFAALKLT